MQHDYQGLYLVLIPVAEKGKKQSGQREEEKCKEDTVIETTNPLGALELERHFRAVPKVPGEPKGHSCGLCPEKGMHLVKEALCSCEKL